MKNHINRYIVPALFCSLLFGACKKQLNVYPTTSKVDGSVITDTKSAQDVLNGVYYRFASSSTSELVTNTQWSDEHEIIPSELAGSLVNAFSDDGIYTINFSDQNSGVKDIWDYGYKLLNAANGFLKNIAPIDNIQPATKNQMIAEAKFLRAFGKATLLLYFGQYDNVASPNGIILRDELVATSNINLPLSPVGEVYASIIKDLDEAIPGLPATASKKHYAPAAAAKILKARVLISRGMPGDYDAVIALMEDVIQNGPYKLEPKLKDIFLTKGFGSNEVILGIQSFPTEAAKFYNYQYFYAGNPVFVNSMANDPRAEWMFEESFPGSYQFTKYYGGDLSDPVATPLSTIGYAFRLTEAYLLQAEALCLKNGDLAKARLLLKTVMERAGITNFSAIDAINDANALHSEVVKETIKNFVGENGTDFFALRRLPLAEIKVIQPNVTSKAELIFPIPFAETRFNPALQK